MNTENTHALDSIDCVYKGFFTVTVTSHSLLISLLIFSSPSQLNILSTQVGLSLISHQFIINTCSNENQNHESKKISAIAWPCVMSDPEGEQQAQQEWLQAMLAVDADSEGQEASLQRGRGRGRAKGSTGSRGLRRALQNWIDEDMDRQQSEVDSNTPQPGSVEYARMIRAQKVENRRELTQRSAGSSVGPNTRDEDWLSAFGDTTQRSLWQAFLKGRKSQQPESDPAVDSLLDGDAVHASTRSVRALKHETSSFPELLLQVGAAIFAFGTWMWGLFLTKVAFLARGACEARMKPIMLLVKLRYDETPMKVQISEESCTHAKVVQSEHTQSMLLEKDGKLLFCASRLPTQLGAVDRTTGENTRSVLWQQVNAIPELSRLTDPFDLRIRVSVADRYSANYRAEKGLQQTGYMDDFINIFLPCDIHKLHAAIRNASNNAASDVAGLLNAGLATVDLGAIQTLRAILISILETDMEIVDGPPPVEVGSALDTFRQGAFDLYLPMHSGVPRAQKRSNAKRRFILSYFLNGDLTSPSLVHHCGRGCCQSKSQTRQHCAMYLSWALIPRKLPVLSRKTWTGYHNALAWAGVLASHHNLFQRVMERHIGKPQLALDKAAPIPDEPAGWLEAMMLMDGCTEPAIANQDENQENPAEERREDEAPEQGNAEAAAGAQQDDWKEKKRQAKRAAQMWLATYPGLRLAVLTDCIEELHHLMDKFLRMSGVNWRRSQERQAFKTGTRKYAVLEAALGTDVALCLEKLLSKVTLPTRAVPDEYAHDLVLKSLKFRIVSCGACAVKSLLWLARSGMPYQIFTALKQDLVSTSRLVALPACMLDGFSSLILRRFPSADALLSAECQGILEAVAVTCDCDIAEIEARHAQTRDFSLARPRGSPPTLESVACRFLCRRHSEGPARKGGRAAPLPKKQKRRRGGGGAWRAYMHEKCAGKKFSKDDIKKLTREYYNLAEDERQRFVRAGEAGATSHRHGFSSFGSASAPLPPLPGEFVQGAVVAEVSPEAVVLADAQSMVPYSDNQFNEAYKELAGRFSAAAREERKSLQQNDEELSNFKANVSGNEMAQLSQGFVSLGDGGTCEVFQMPLSSAAGMVWAPPVSPAVKDCRGLNMSLQ